jgi:hypothetical protein
VNYAVLNGGAAAGGIVVAPTNTRTALEAEVLATSHIAKETAAALEDAKKAKTEWKQRVGPVSKEDFWRWPTRD